MENTHKVREKEQERERKRKRVRESAVELTVI